MNRRKILGGMIAAPFAGKKIAEASARSLGGTVLGNAAMIGPARADYGGAGQFVYDSTVPNKPEIPEWKLFRQHGIPDWARQQWERDYPKVPRVDDDIAELRSVSSAGKRQMQRKRDWEKYEAESTSNKWDDFHEMRTAWYKKLGIW